MREEKPKTLEDSLAWSIWNKLRDDGGRPPFTPLDFYSSVRKNIIKCSRRMSCALSGGRYRWGGISISGCYLLLWNSRGKTRNNFNFHSSYLNYCFNSKNLWRKEHPSLLFTTGVKPQEQKKICNFLELQVIIWEDKVSSIRNYFYMTSLILTSIIYGGNHSVALRAVRPAPCWAASLVPGVPRDCPEITRCQSTPRSITIFFFF